MAPTPASPRTPLTEFGHTVILIIDDDPTYRFLLRGLCAKLGIGRIEEATNGEDGIARALDLRPDLILLDIVMPGISGLDVCRQLRTTPLTANTAILVQTGLTDEKERMACFNAGATDVVSKPLNAAEFSARVRTHLRNAIYARSLADFRKRIEMHLDIARGFMDAVLPNTELARELALRNGFELSVVHRTHEEIGGDLWYLHEIELGRLLVLIIDASAHGLAGAINALRIDSLLRELWRHHQDPHELLRALDEAMAQSPCGRLFAAVTAAILDSRSDKLWYASSGNPYPIVLHDGAANALPTGGLPLGSGLATVDLNEVSLNTGDTLVLHTDGWPARSDVNPVDLVNYFSTSGVVNAESLLGQDPAHDDLTLMTLRRI